jgi:hypothetical protein
LTLLGWDAGDDRQRKLTIVLVHGFWAGSMTR